MAPYTLGYVPFGLFTGTVVARSGDPLAGWAGTLTIYGGGAHVLVLELLRGGAALSAAVLAAVMLNTRVLLYSTDLRELWAGARPRVRWLAAGTVIDVTWSVALERAERPGSLAERRAHYAGAALTLSLGWLTAVTTGALLAARFGTSHGPILESAAPLCLAAIVAPYARRRPQVLAIGSAVAVAVAAHAAGAATGVVVLLGMVVAAGAGVAARRWAS